MRILLPVSLLLGSLTTAALGAALQQEDELRASTTQLPDYFQTDRSHFAGPTATGVAPFLAQYNPAPFPGVSYTPNTPLETQVPIAGNKHNENIFEMFGHLSHYFPNPSGFGVDEHPLPPGAEISWLNMIHRHGSRYATLGSPVFTFTDKLKNLTGTFKAKGDLKFLNDWFLALGYEILVPIGKQELFDSGTLHYYQYGHLYPNNGSKIIVRTPTQDRMVQSAEYFLAGFFGLDWASNATLEVIIERNGFNNSLAGYFDCKNNRAAASYQGNVASHTWTEKYLAKATKRLQDQITGWNWTVEDSYAAQTLCAYETVGLGYSPFCGLFDIDEWKGYEYSVDLAFSGNNMFQSPIGRAVGIGYVQEVLARLNHHYLEGPAANTNWTLDNGPETFPLDQKLNLDFSHDTNIAHVLTAFGLTQFSKPLPATYMDDSRLLKVSHLTPFAARLDIEVITAPKPVCATRSACTYDESSEGGQTKYIHFILNQRTIPLGASFAECGQRDDGWCELDTFLKVQADSLERSEYEWACWGDYVSVEHGTLRDGVPLPRKGDTGRQSTNSDSMKAGKHRSAEQVVFGKP